MAEGLTLAEAIVLSDAVSWIVMGKALAFALFHLGKGSNASLVCCLAWLGLVMMAKSSGIVELWAHKDVGK